MSMPKHFYGSRCVNRSDARAQSMFSSLEVRRLYGVPAVTRETIYRSFLAQPVEHVLGPGASRLFECWSCKHVQASKPARSTTRNAILMASPTGCATRLGPATPIRHQSLLTNHQSLLTLPHRTLAPSPISLGDPGLGAPLTDQVTVPSISAHRC